MTRKEFETLVAQEWPRAIPEKFRPLIKNVGFLIEDRPSPDVRRREGLGARETLLGYYQGIPHTARGDMYGVGTTFPDTITLYQGPIEEEAMHMGGDIARVVRETIWHEVAHHFGFNEHAVRLKEKKRDERRKKDSA